MLEKSWEWGINKLALFIGMEKVFDRVKREGLWTIMMDEHYSIPKKFIGIIKNMNSCCIGKVKGRGWEREWFDIKTGVRQGDVSSPLLFISFMDKCVRDAGYGHVGRETLIMQMMLQ